MGNVTLASRKSSPHRFAHLRLAAGIIERVVDKLEGNAQMVAVAPEAFDHLFAAAGDHGARLRGGGEEGGGLGRDHAQVILFGGGEVVGRFELHHLALGDDGGGAGEDVEHGKAAGVDHELEGAAEEEIADQHAGLVAPHHIGGELAAAQGGGIHHVVVQQGGCVDELDGGGQLHMGIARVFAGAGGGQCQHGAQALAARFDQVLRHIGNQGYGRAHAAMDDGVGRVHVRGHERVQAVHGGGLAVVLGLGGLGRDHVP